MDTPLTQDALKALADVKRAELAIIVAQIIPDEPGEFERYDTFAFCGLCTACKRLNWEKPCGSDHADCDYCNNMKEMSSRTD